MGRYFVRGRSPQGRRTTERIIAPDAKRALEELSGRGYTELELLSSAFEAAPVDEEEQLPSAEQSVMPFRGDWYPGWIVLKAAWFVWVPALAYLVYRFVLDRPFGFSDALALAGIVLVAGLALWAAASVLPCRRLLRAVARGRWEEVLRRADALAGSTGFSSKIPSSELNFRRASALQRLGRESEAEAALAAARGDASQMGWLLEVRTATHYAARGDRSRAKACYQAAIALSPETAEPHLALAEFQAGHLVRDPAAARESLATALQFPVAESVRWAATRIEGMVLLEEGDAEGALVKLRLARRQFRRLADTGVNILADAYLGAYLCLAYAALGDRPSAMRELRAAERWLEPHGLGDLLERCRLATRDG